MKFAYLGLLIAAGATCLCVEAMYGGEFYPITEAPYQAQLMIMEPNEYNYCGATILSEYWLVTAAHCVAKNVTIQVTIRLGTSTRMYKGKELKVSEIIVHDKYETQFYTFDIGLIKAAEKIEFSEYHYPIQMSREPPKPGDVVIASGYGKSHYQLYGLALKISRLHVIEDATCQRNYSTIPTQFCTDVKDADLCSGDSGGPAVLDGKLVGVASQGCEYDAPVVFTKVSVLYDWILEKTGIKYDWRKRRSTEKARGGKNRRQR